MNWHPNPEKNQRKTALLQTGLNFSSINMNVFKSFVLIEFSLAIYSIDFVTFFPNHQ